MKRQSNLGQWLLYRSIGVLALLGLSLIGSCWSTQRMADRFGYVRQLGAPWVSLGSLRLYAPWAWIDWMQKWYKYAEQDFDKAFLVCGACALAGVMMTAIVVALTPKGDAASEAHGSSRWMTTKELRKAGYLHEAGVVLCQTDKAKYRSTIDANGTPVIEAKRNGELVRHNGPEHILCFAPTRSGKGVGLVVPTLLEWEGSVIVYDIKKENWELTAGSRKAFSHVWKFEPTSDESIHFNPLMEIRKGANEVRDTQNVADILVDPNGELKKRDHWQTTAHELLAGAILHVLYARPDKTLAGVRALLSDPSRPRLEMLNDMLTTRHLPTGPHPLVEKAARTMLNKTENELSGVFSTASACLGLYDDPTIATNTSTSDFRIADLMNADFPVSLYLVVPPSDIDRLRPLIRLMLNQIGRRLTESMSFHGSKSYKHRLLLLLDEFPSLGRLDFFETTLAFIAGYGMKAFLIAQSLNQLEDKYGPKNSILDNCHVRVTYAANDEHTAKRISDLLGQSTETRIQRTYSGSGVFLSNRSESVQEYGRPLLMPSEVMQLPADEVILLIGGQPPYLGRKVRHYLDKRFKDYAKMPAPAGAKQLAKELLKAPPNVWEGAIVAVAVEVSNKSPAREEPAAAADAQNRRDKKLIS